VEVAMGGQEQQQYAAPPTATSNPFGFLVRTLASHRFLKRPESSSALLNLTAKSPPPLARQRSETPKESSKQPEEDFSVTASSSVLADDELAQLAKMKQFSTQGRLAVLLSSLQDNRRLLFIVLTLILSAWVYFYSRRTLEDDVM
jgi:hypothetical protein